VVTGLHFTDTLTPPSDPDKPPLPPRKQSDYHEKASLAASSAVKRRPDAPGVRFTFILYENQRRWVGLGWTTSLFAYERAAWTDEHLNVAPAKEDFELPDVEDGAARWRWVEGSQWLVEGADPTDEGGMKAKADTSNGGQGWIYYDNKWQNGRRGQDGWGRYTRRRKWYRDAELVEVSPSTEITPSPTPTRTTSTASPQTLRTGTSSISHPSSDSRNQADNISIKSVTIQDDNSSRSDKEGIKSMRGGKPGSLRRRTTSSRRSSLSLKGPSDDDVAPHRQRQADWGIGDDARMGLE